VPITELHRPAGSAPFSWLRAFRHEAEGNLQTCSCRVSLACQSGEPRYQLQQEEWGLQCCFDCLSIWLCVSSLRRGHA